LAYDYENLDLYNSIHYDNVSKTVKTLREHRKVPLLPQQSIENVCVLVPNLHYGIPILYMLVMRYLQHMTSLCQ